MADSLSLQEKQLIFDTFQRIAPHSEQVANDFYTNLFAMHPETQPLFANVDMKLQADKFIQMIAVVVNAIFELNTVEEAMHELGMRHVSYGTQVEHYNAVGDAFLTTLQSQLGDAYTDDAHAAWSKLYAQVVAMTTSNLP